MTDHTETTGRGYRTCPHCLRIMPETLDCTCEPALKQSTAFPNKRVRMVRPGAIGITISGTEYVMSVSDANDLIGLINRAKHDGMSGAEHAD